MLQTAASGEEEQFPYHTDKACLIAITTSAETGEGELGG